MHDFSRCWFLTGPTASGKTAVGLELAERIGAEIVSLDSMAVYRGLDIGTAKPTADERRRVPHHLIDLVSPAEDYSLARYLADAATAVAEIVGRGRVPLFVGGTPLYLKALLRGVATGPPPDWELRRQLARLAGEGHDLHARLREVDPITAARLPPGDIKRIIRALEVYEHTGRPLSAWQADARWTQPRAVARVFTLAWPRAELHARINARVEAMFAAGLVAEVVGLLEAGVEFSRTARQALGYRDVLEHLQGQRDLAATIELVQTRTRQFAKRQETWYRHLPECRRVEVREPLDPWRIATAIESTAHRVRDPSPPSAGERAG
jgi:tRNA dimethylallyltransferase